MFILRNIVSFLKNESQDHLKLILKSKIFYIPSEFPNLNDIDQDIYSALASDKQYNVLSNVSDDVLQSFINNWVYNKNPDIQKDNINQYEQLAKEFDRMKDVIQMHKFYIALANKKEALTKLINEKKQYYNYKTERYLKILSIYNNCNITNQLKYPFTLFKDINIDTIKIDTIEYILQICASNESIYKKEIPTNIKSIKFSLNSNSIYIPSNIKTIEEGWCKKMPNLKYISISKNNRHFIYYKNKLLLGKLEDKSDNFDNLIFARTDIEKIEIPPFIKRIASYAFAHCVNLKSIELSPNSEIKSIGKFAFYGTKIEKINIPSSIVDLNPRWFYGGINYLKCFHLDSRNETYKIYDNLFLLKKSNPLNDSYDVIIELLDEREEIIIPSFITEIGPYVFQGSLVSRIKFDNNSQLRIIGKHAFSDSNLECIAIPQHVIEIGKKAFLNCNNFKKIDFAENAEIISFNESLFGKTKLTNIKIPASVTQIYNYVFNDCQIKNIEFSMNSKLKSIYDEAFFCPTLESISIPSCLVEIKSFWFFNKPFLNTINVFQNGKTNVICSNKLVFVKSDLNEDIFDILFLAERDIENVTIPSFVKQIGKFAFERCTKITNVTFSNSNNLYLINDSSFEYSSITDISIPSCVVRIGRYSFKNCMQLKRIDFMKNSKLKIIDKFAFSQSAIESIVIPRNVTKIKKSAFSNCNTLKMVSFENDSKLVKISNNAFCECSFNSMLIPTNVISIGYKAFHSLNDAMMIFEIDENSKLYLIDFNSFNYAILMIPVKLNGKIKFNVPPN